MYRVDIFFDGRRVQREDSNKGLYGSLEEAKEFVNLFIKVNFCGWPVDVFNEKDGSSHYIINNPYVNITKMIHKVRVVIRKEQESPENFTEIGFWGS